MGADVSQPKSVASSGRTLRVPSDLPTIADPDLGSAGPESRIRFPATSWLSPVLLLTFFATTAVIYVGLAWSQSRREMDLHIYREAMTFVSSGHFLYDYMYQYILDGKMQTLGFTYPPFAALLLRPLAALPEVPTQVAWLAMSFIGVLLLALALVWGLHREGRLDRPTLRNPRTWTVGLWFAVAILVSIPTLGQVVFGQVSLALVLLIFTDMTVVPPRWRGPLTGIAAAIKLTPLVFIGYLLLARQWRASAQAAVTFVACALLGWWVLPRESAAYWGFWLWQPSRVGNPAMEDNKSLLGLVSRAAGTGGFATVVWLIAVLFVAAVGLRHAIRLSQAGFHSSGALIVGCVSLAVSPISWPHHQFWVLLLALTAIVSESRPWWNWGMAILFLFNSCLLFVTFTPEGPLTPLGELPVLVIAACCLVGLPALRAHPEQPTPLS